MDNKPDFGRALKELADRRSDEFKSFIRQILVICSSILGILVVFRDEKITDKCELYSFIVTIGLFALCILIGLIVLYGEIYTLDKLRSSLVDTENKLRRGDENVSGIIAVPNAKFFSISAKVFYVIFGLAICSIVVYSYLAFS